MNTKIDQKRSIKVKLAVIFGVVSLGSIFFAQAVVKATGGSLPPGKQVIETAYYQTRIAGYQNPAPKDPIAAAPTPGPAYQYPTGIINDGEAPLLAEEITIINRWQGPINGDLWIIYAGSYVNDPNQGLVVLSVLSDKQVNLVTEKFLTPTKAGAVKIVGIYNQRISLATNTGYSFIFDIPLKSFINYSFLPILAK